MRPAPIRHALAAVLMLALAGCGAPGGSGVDRAAGSTAAQDTATRAPLRIVVLSDLNSSYGSTSYEAEVHAAVERVTTGWRPDLVLIAGDMIAGQRPSLTDENVRTMWAAFDATVAAPLRAAGIPLAFTLGNHDASGHPAHARDRRLAAEYWGDPARTPALAWTDTTHYPFSYAFVLRDVFFLVLNASTGNVAADSGQLSWIRRTLASEPARRAHTRIALGHVPLYAVAQERNRAGEVQAQPDSLRRILERGNVAMYVAGHHHAYFPGRRGALLLLSTGALGQGPRPLLQGAVPPYKALTLLEVRPGMIDDRTFRIDGAVLEPVELQTLPMRIDGINGFVVRRDVSGGN